MYYWTKEKCIEVALLCETKKEFREKYEGAYKFSYKNGILEEICSHMKIYGNLYKRLIYSCEFNDNSIYIGLTCNSDRRKEEHFNKNGSVYNHIIKTGLHPEYKELTSYLDVEEAIKLENYYVEYYKNLGYNILNKIKTGSIGGDKIKWTYETCKEESKLHINKSLFRQFKYKAYKKSKEEGWLEEFYVFNSSDKKPNGYWTKEKCIEVISLCNTKKEFIDKYGGAFYSCRKNNWINEISKNLNKEIR